MAVAFLLEFPGATVAQYDAVVADLGLVHEPPPGLRYHVAGPNDGGLRLVDVGESPAAFDTFLRERLGAAMAKEGIAPPRVQSWPVHGTLPS